MNRFGIERAETTTNHIRVVQPTDSERRVEEVVNSLRGLSRAAGFEFALRVGQIVVDGFYAGDLKAWKARGRKEASFRKLARRPDLPMSASALYRCVAIYELCSRIPSFSRWRHLSVCHARAVLVTDEAMQESLLERAEEKRWSVAKLEAEVRRLRPHRLTVSTTPAPRKLLNVGTPLRAVVRACERLDESRLCAASPEAARRALLELDNVRQVCDALERSLRRRLPSH